jgi:hypothetical protein
VAIAIRIRAASATREQFNGVDDALTEWVTANGGPPEGFLSLVAYAEGGGFEVVVIWRNEDLWQAWWRGKLRQLYADAGIEMEVVGTAPVWSLVRG